MREGGRKEGGQEARNNGLAPRCCVHLPIYTCYFESCKLRAIYKRWFDKVVSAVQFTDFSGTRCKHHAVCAMCR